MKIKLITLSTLILALGSLQAMDNPKPAAPKKSSALYTKDMGKSLVNSIPALSNLSKNSQLYFKYATLELKDLPQELQGEIIRHLLSTKKGIKHLLRFSTVNKYWRKMLMENAKEVVLKWMPRNEISIFEYQSLLKLKSLITAKKNEIIIHQYSGLNQALRGCCIQNMSDLARGFIQEGAQVNSIVRNSRTPIPNPPSMFNSFKSSSCNFTLNTPLICATTANSPEVVKLLLEQGANPYIQDQEGNTALKIAKEKKFTEIITLLEKKF